MGHGTIILKVGPDTLIGYQHLGTGEQPEKSGILVQEGEPIEPGTPIGIVGNTGHVISTAGGDGTHLHVFVIDVSERNPEIKKLKFRADSGDRGAETKLGKIKAAFKDAVSAKDSKQRDAAIRNLIFNNQELIYMNPWEAIWTH